MTVPDFAADFFRRMEEEPWFSGSSVNAFTVDSMGNNMLEYAIIDNNLQVIRYLIEVGVDVNGKGEFGYTPLITAMESEEYGVACYLLCMGANGNIKNDDDLSAFDILKLKFFGDC